MPTKDEQKRLFELFGDASQWDRTLHGLTWAHSTEVPQGAAVRGDGPRRIGRGRDGLADGGGTRAVGVEGAADCSCAGARVGAGCGSRQRRPRGDAAVRAAALPAVRVRRTAPAGDDQRQSIQRACCFRGRGRPRQARGSRGRPARIHASCHVRRSGPSFRPVRLGINGLPPACFCDRRRKTVRSRDHHPASPSRVAAGRTRHLTMALDLSRSGAIRLSVTRFATVNRVPHRSSQSSVPSVTSSLLSGPSVVLATVGVAGCDAAGCRRW